MRAALLAVAVCLLLPAAAQAAETIEFQSSYSYGTNGFSHSVQVDVTGGAVSGSLQVLWSLDKNGAGAVAQTPVPVTLDGSGNGSANLTYTPSYNPGTAATDVISAVCADNDSSGTCDGGEPQPTVYTTHTIYVYEPSVGVTGSTSYNTGDSASLTVTAYYYDGTVISGGTVHWSRTGANGSSSNTVTTNGSGQATIPSWSGTNPGQDNLRVWIDDPLGTTNTYDSGEGTSTAAVTFTEGTVALSALNAYYLAGGPGDTLTATVYSDGNNSATTPTTPVGAGVTILFQVNGGAVQSAPTDANSQITIPVSSSTVGAWSVYVWRDVVTADNLREPGEPTSYASTYFNRPSVSSPIYTPAESLGIGQNVTLSFQTRDFDNSALGNQVVCWYVSAGPHAGSHGQTAATDSGGNGTYIYTSATVGVDVFSLWLQSQAACGTSVPGAPVIVTPASVTWGMAISTGGPVTEIYLGPTLACQALYTLDTQGEFYGYDYGPASCTPFVIVDGTNRYLSAVSQTGPTPVSGGGFKVVTVGCVNVASTCPGGTDPLLTQTVTYFPGDNFYRTDYALKSRDNASHTVRIYQYADCYLQNSDSGYGFHSSVAAGGNGGVYCSQHANNSPQGRIEGFVPIDPGASYYEAGYSTTSGAIASAAGTNHMFDASGDVTNTCQCATFQDNGMAIGWQAGLAAGGTVTRSLLTDFSPVGVTADIYPPNVSLDVPVDGSQTTDAQPAFSGQAGTLSGDLPTVTVDVYAGSAVSGSPVATFNATASSGSWSVKAGSPLALGTYTARASQSDQDGNVGHSAAHTFTIVAPPSPGPKLGPNPPPPPVFARAVNVVPVSGQVFIIVNGQKVPLTDPTQVKVGTVIDAHAGRVSLTSVDKQGHPQTADFYLGTFKIVQLAKDKGVTEIDLVDKSAKICGKKPGKAAFAARKKKPKSRGLVWGSGQGKFKTKGQFASALVRGTAWKTEDRCDGTLVQVKSGKVTVTDLVKHKVFLVKGGHQYLAKPGKG